MTDNPYQSTTALPTSKSTVAQSPWHGLVLSVLSLIVGLFFGWQTLVLYAFSTTVDPQISGPERARMIADRFLFGDGPFQVVFVCLFLYLAATGFISAVLFLAFAVFHRPPLKVITILSCCVGAMITSAIVGYLVMR